MSQKIEARFAKMKNSQQRKFKLTCPECEAAVIIASPESAIWERCPSCGLHVWDMNDVMMAEAMPEGARTAVVKPGLGIQ